MGEAVELHQEQQATQDRLPKVKEVIDRVGVSGLKTSLRLSRPSGESHFSAEIDLFIDLPEDRKGIHMSRLVESINDVISRGSRRSRASFEKLGMDILLELKKRHRYSKGEIRMKTTLFVSRHTPVTNHLTEEPYDVSIGIRSDGDVFFKNMMVAAIGNTLCPHSLETTHGKAHVQRARVELEIEAPIKEKIPLEDLIDICENSFSSPTYTVLKTVDEAEVVEEMFRNPKFVEDVVRDCFRQARNLKFKGRVKIRAVSYESIHKHNAVSEIERVFE